MAATRGSATAVPGVGVTGATPREAVGGFWDTRIGIYPDNRVRVTLLVEEGVAAGTSTDPSRCRTGTGPGRW